MLEVQPEPEISSHDQLSAPQWPLGELSDECLKPSKVWNYVIWWGKLFSLQIDAEFLKGFKKL